MAFKWGDTIQSPGNWDQSEEIKRLMAEQGKDYGDWQTDPTTGIRYIDTPYGRVQNANQLMYNPNVEEGSTAYMDPNKTQGLVGGRHANEKGSDAIRGVIDDQGVVTRMGMDRESEKDRNLAIAGIVGLGAAAYLGAGAAASGAGGAGGASGGAIVTPVAEGSVVSGGSIGGGSLVNSVAGEAAAGYSDAAIAGYGAGGEGAFGMGTAASTAASTAGGLEGGSSWWSKLFGMSNGSAQLLGGLVSGIGQAYSASEARDAARQMQAEQIAASREMQTERLNFTAAEAQKEREWKARNFQPGSMPVIDWK